jgi:hypothetical protein
MQVRCMERPEPGRRHLSLNPNEASSRRDPPIELGPNGRPFRRGPTIDPWESKILPLTQSSVSISHFTASIKRIAAARRRDRFLRSGMTMA